MGSSMLILLAAVLFAEISLNSQLLKFAFGSITVPSIFCYHPLLRSLFNFVPGSLIMMNFQEVQ